MRCGCFIFRQSLVCEQEIDSLKWMACTKSCLWRITWNMQWLASLHQHVFFGFFFKVEMSVCVIYASQIIILKSIGFILELYFALLTLQKRQT